MTLRPYQEEAVLATYDYLKKNPGKNPIICLPTGTGKTHVIKRIASDVVFQRQERVLILAHRKELLTQTLEKFGGNASVYSASLRSKQAHGKVVIAQVQSCFSKADTLGTFGVVLIDECHLVPETEGGMYRTLLAGLRRHNANLRVIGLTATPYRLESGLLTDDDGIFDDLSYDYCISKAIQDGYLSPLVSRVSSLGIEPDELRVRGGEYRSDDVADAVESVEKSACDEIIRFTRDRKSVLIFAANRLHAERVCKLIPESHWLSGDTPVKVRDILVNDFRAGKIKYLVNIDVLSTGFDATNVDCVVMLRPTKSRALYVQQVGRGLRLHPGKSDCLVLDYAGNIRDLGPLDAPPAMDRQRSVWTERQKRHPKEFSSWVCPDCGYVNKPSPMCSGCGRDVREYVAKHGVQADDVDIMTKAGIAPRKPKQWLEVGQVDFVVHPGKGDKPPSMKVSYYIDGWQWPVNEWICIEHDGFAKTRAKQWWSERTDAPLPGCSKEAVTIAAFGGVADTYKIYVDTNEKFPKICDYVLGPKVGWGELEDEELPF